MLQNYTFRTDLATNNTLNTLFICFSDFLKLHFSIKISFQCNLGCKNFDMPENLAKFVLKFTC